MGNFKPVTTNNDNRKHANYNDAFQESYPIINRHDFRNQHNTLHNNMADSLVNEHVTEYRINIDARNRDATTFPNPFDFTVTFAPPSRQAIKEKVFVDPNDPSKGKTIQTTYVGGTPEPSISRKFKNVKYVKVESIVLPKYFKVVNDGGTYGLDGSESVDDDRFIVLEIPELRSTNNFGTNTNVENGFIVFPDRVYNTMFTGMTFYANRVFDDNALGNINRLTFKIKNSWGEQYALKIVDPAGKDLPEKLDTDPANSANLNNVYHKIFQTHITLVVGVFENNLNTLAKYEQ